MYFVYSNEIIIQFNLVLAICDCSTIFHVLSVLKDLYFTLCIFLINNENKIFSLVIFNEL